MSDVRGAEGSAGPFPDSSFGSEAVTHLLAAFNRLSHPMLIADDDRRWMAGNDPAADLLGISQKEIPFHTIDEFTPLHARGRLAEQWEAFLSSGAAEGSYELDIPRRGLVTLEFSATANVLPARHLWIFIAPDAGLTEQARRASAGGPAWTPHAVPSSRGPKLTTREREIMTLVAAGGHSGDIADLLFVSAETVKAHVSNAMSKLGAHTRAHAVIRALLTGQITLEG